MSTDTKTIPPSISLSFTASTAMSDSLQHVLVDLIALEHVGKQIHWNVVESNFRDVHLNLDEVVALPLTALTKWLSVYAPSTPFLTVAQPWSTLQSPSTQILKEKSSPVTASPTPYLPLKQ